MSRLETNPRGTRRELRLSLSGHRQPRPLAGASARGVLAVSTRRNASSTKSASGVTLRSGLQVAPG